MGAAVIRQNIHRRGTPGLWKIGDSRDELVNPGICPAVGRVSFCNRDVTNHFSQSVLGCPESDTIDGSSPLDLLKAHSVPVVQTKDSISHRI
jgi:hypothetical protein